MRELESLLPDLDPPAGGFARLRQSIAAARRPMYLQSRWMVACAVCVATVVIALTLPPWIVRQQRTDALVQAMRGGVAPSVSTIGVEHGAAIELPSGQANVKLFLVQTAATGR